MMNEEDLRNVSGHPRVALVLSDSAEARIAALEDENLRLQQLVAELLLKNQQLRRQDA